MLPLSLKIAPQGLLPFDPPHVAPWGITIISNLFLRDCFCPSPTLLLREAYPSKLPLRDCFPHLLPGSLLLRKSLPFPCFSSFHPRDVPSSFSGIIPSSPKLPLKDCSSCHPLHVAPQGNGPLSSKLSLRFGPSSPSGIIPSWIIPLLPVRDHVLIPKTVPQGLTLTASRVTPFVPRLSLRDGPHPFRGSALQGSSPYSP